MLNAVVQCPYCTFTVYGNRSTSDFPTIMVIVQENTPLTIADGATLTVPQGESISILSLQSLTNRGTIVNQGEITISSDSLGTPDLGGITNDGLIAMYVEKNSSGEEIPAFIKALNLTGGTLTLAEGFNAETVILPGNGAVVEANGGVSVAASGGVDGTVTVNGTLTARADGGAAVLTGKISVGPSGRLEVYGNKGVQLGGVNKGSGPDSVIDFTNAFLLAPGGRFTGECENSVILASKYSGAEFEEGLRAEDIISIPGGSGGYGGGYSDDRDDGDSGVSSYPVTVERAVTVRAAFKALEEENCPSRAFSDLDAGAWYHEAVDYVLQNGLMGGYGDGRFGPGNVLTRAQFAQILYNQADRPAAREALRWAVGAGVMNGKTGGALDPKGLATRAQAAQMLKNFLENG